MQNKKLRSRKFFTFIIWMAYVGYILIGKPPTELVKEITPWFGGVTMVYVGFQAVVDFIPSIIDVIMAWKGGKDETP